MALNTDNFSIMNQKNNYSLVFDSSSFQCLKYWSFELSIIYELCVKLGDSCLSHFNRTEYDRLDSKSKSLFGHSVILRVTRLHRVFGHVFRHVLEERGHMYLSNERADTLLSEFALAQYVFEGAPKIFAE
jgi:hypothetical protein